MTPQTLRGIASDGSTVAAVGTGGAVVSWPAKDPRRSAGDLLGHPDHVAGHRDRWNGTWVTGGSGGVVLTSTDLRTWDRHSIGSDGDIFAIAYGAGHFVAVTDIGGIATSADGITWTTTRQSDGLWLWGVTFGPGGFLAVGADGTALLSPDGSTWTAGCAPHARNGRNFAEFGDEVGAGDDPLADLGGLVLGIVLDGLGCSAPAARSLIVTLPSARSLEPTMTAAAALRRSAYFICAFMPDEPRYISARMPAWRSSLVIFW